jgi:hypothetical protein
MSAASSYYTLMLSVWENYCPDQVTFSGAEPSHPTTVDRLVILEDDKLDTLNPKVTTVSALVDTSTDFAFKLSKLIDLFNYKA